MQVNILEPPNLNKCLHRLCKDKTVCSYLKSLLRVQQLNVPPINKKATFPTQGWIETGILLLPSISQP